MWQPLPEVLQAFPDPGQAQVGPGGGEAVADLVAQVQRPLVLSAGLVEQTELPVRGADGPVGVGLGQPVPQPLGGLQRDLPDHRLVVPEAARMQVRGEVEGELPRVRVALLGAGPLDRGEQHPVLRGEPGHAHCRDRRSLGASTMGGGGVTEPRSGSSTSAAAYAVCR